MNWLGRHSIAATCFSVSALVLTIVSTAASAQTSTHGRRRRFRSWDVRIHPRQRLAVVDRP
jgi:hypothetical protein